MSKNLNLLQERGYQIERQLGENTLGGSVTYLATDCKTKLPVIIKQFQFAKTGTSWTKYEAHKQEIAILKSLSHPNIPLYLDEIETSKGFCLVTEYKGYPAAAIEQNYTPAEIKQIAIGVLEILVYLQQQNPSIIHGDIKPENILIARGETIAVYLVGFGSATFADARADVNHTVEGTLGFMSPEQLFKQPLNNASDLYSLGASLICLLSEMRSSDICQQLDDSYSFNLDRLKSKLHPSFIKWLSKMVAPQLKDRYPNAAIALQALKKIPVVGNSFFLANRFGNLSLKIIPPMVTLASLGLGLGLLTTARNSNVINAINPINSDTVLSKLLTTGDCAYCNLEGEQLRQMSLEGANLYEANLEGAQLQGANLQGANLQTSNLEGAQLQGANLNGAYPRSANLSRAKLNGAQLQGADFSLSNLQEAQLRGANLTGAKLQETRLEGAYLEGAILKDANLRYAYLGFAFLDGVNLQGANLDFANLESAFLQSAYLKDADLSGAFLRNANLAGANLVAANLSKANLTGANLTGANLMAVDFKGANLTGANLKGANITYAKLRGANLTGAIMPDGRIYRSNSYRSSRRFYNRFSSP